MILPVILLLVWYLITRMQVFSLYLLPSPGMVWDALTELAASGELVKHLSISLRRVFLGFLLAACTAIPLGILCGRSRYFYTYCWFLLEFLRHVPPLAAIPLIILWAGIDEASKLTIIFLASFFPLFLNTCSGICNCDPKLLEVGQSLGFSKAQLIRHIQLPAALEAIVTGLQLSLGYSWRAPGYCSGRHAVYRHHRQHFGLGVPAHPAAPYSLVSEKIKPLRFKLRDNKYPF